MDEVAGRPTCGRRMKHRRREHNMGISSYGLVVLRIHQSNQSKLVKYLIPTTTKTITPKMTKNPKTIVN